MTAAVILLGTVPNTAHIFSYGCRKKIDTQIVQSNEVISSVHMVLEGLKRCLQHVQSRGVDIVRVVTDRHTQVKKYVHEEHPNKSHDFDVWHVGKGTEKKLLAASQRKNSADIKPWIPSIKNHLYWVANSIGTHEARHAFCALVFH